MPCVLIATCIPPEGTANMRQVSIAASWILVAVLILILAEALSPTISAPHAIAIALEHAVIGGTELGRIETLPTNIQATQMTLGAIQDRVTPDDPNLPVWLVSMEGIWTPGGFVSPDYAAQHPLHHYSIIINAKSGNVLWVRATP